VLKERLADTRMNAAGQLEIVQLVPPRLPVATVQAIRAYIANPPDYDKLKTGERVIEERMTDETKLRLEAARAEADRDAEVARNQRLERMEGLRAQQAAQQAAAQPGKASDKTAEMQAAKTEAKQAEAATADMAAKMEEGKRLAAATPPENQEVGRGNPDAGAKPDVNGKATIAQVADIKKLCQACGVTREKLVEMIARVKAAKVTDMSYQHAAILIDKLEKASLKVPVEGVPFAAG
jgi:hypothetical protein